MDLKNIKSWQIAAAGLIPTAIFAFIFIILVGFGGGGNVAFGYLLSIIAIVVSGIFSLPVLCLKSKNNTAKKIGAACSIFFGILYVAVFWIVGIFRIASLGFPFIFAGIYSFWKTQ